MGTRGKWRKGRGSGVRSQGLGVGGREVAPAEPENGGEDKDTPAPTPAQTPAQSQAAPAIHKGAYLSALIYVEGDLPAPEDFTSKATSAVKEALGEALKANPGGLSMSLKRVEVQNDVEESAAEEAQTDSKEEKFQF